MQTTFKVLKYSLLSALTVVTLLFFYGLALKFNLVEQTPPDAEEVVFKQCLDKASSFAEIKQCMTDYSAVIDVDTPVDNKPVELTEQTTTESAPVVQPTNEVK